MSAQNRHKGQGKTSEAVQRRRRAQPAAGGGQHIRPVGSLSSDLSPSAREALERERERAEEALRESERRFRRLAEASSEGILIHDNGRILDANQTLARMVGYGLSELIGMEAPRLVAPEWRDFVLQTRLSGYEEPYEAVGLRKDGSTFLAELCGKAVPCDGRTVRVVAIRDITARKRAEEALRESESKGRTLLENLPQKIFFKDKDSVYVSCNENYAQDLKIRPHQIVGKTDYEFYPKELAEKYRADDKRIMESGQTEDIEEAYVQYGQGVFVHTVKTPVRDEAGQVVGVLGIFWDVTERKRAEEALHESEERFRQVAEASREWIWEFDAEGRYTYCSPGVKDILGYEPEEMIGRPYYEFFTPEDKERIRPMAMDIFARRGSFFRLVNANVHKDGHTVVIESTGRPVLDAEGNVVGYRGVDQDITERKRAEQALEQSERRYRLLAENVTDVIWTVDPNLRTTYISPSVTHLWGYSVEEVVTRTVDQMLTPASFDVAMKALVEELAAESTGQSDPSRSRTLELESVCRDGSTIWTEAKMSGLRDELGRLVGILGVSRDITERRRAEQALEQSERRYRLLAENVTDVIWTMDRDLCTTYISPSVTRLRGYSVQEAMAQTLEEVLTPASLELAREVLAEELASESAGQSDPSRSRTLELEHSCKNGSTVWAEVRMTALRDDTGRIVQILGISRDISERRRAEEALQEAREELDSRVERRMRRGSAYGLTFRELTVLHLVVAGESDKEIAATLGISTLTANKHLANILHKMGAASRTEAGVRAIRERLLD